MSVVITGASGQLARIASELVLERLPASEVILVTRTPETLSDLADRGADVRSGDFDQPDALPAALSGGRRMLLISTDALGRRIEQHRNAIRAAAAAGVEHIAYTSILEPIPENPAFVVEEHAQTEAELRGSVLSWTMLRMGSYSEFLIGPAAQAAASGRWVHNAGEGACTYVSRADCAAAAVAVLTGGGHEGAIYDITGPEALTQVDVAALAGEIVGRPIEAAEVGDDEYAERFVAAGFPDWLAAGFATWGQAIRKGMYDRVSTAVGDLTGRRPRSVRDVLTAHRDELLET
jgi:NAD(P)H dehydrogenase (quinone)